jgi:hypothetical protein
MATAILTVLDPRRPSRGLRHCRWSLTRDAAGAAGSPNPVADSSRATTRRSGRHGVASGSRGERAQDGQLGRARRPRPAQLLPREVLPLNIAILLTTSLAVAARLRAYY